MVKPPPSNARPSLGLAAASMLVLAAFGLAGCRLIETNSGADTAAELQPKVQAASSETEKVLGRPFTTVRSGLGPSPCSGADGNSDGYGFLLDERKARRDTDRPAMARQIEAFWRTKNYDVDSYTDAKVTRVRAQFAAGWLDLQMGITTNDIILRAGTECAREAGT